MLALSAGCAGAGGMGRGDPVAEGKVDPRLIRASQETPEAEVGVLIRTVAEVGEAEREALREAGLTVGVVVGSVVTGRLRAGAALRLGGLRFVEYVELAEVVPVPRVPGGAGGAR